MRQLHFTLDEHIRDLETQMAMPAVRQQVEGGIERRNSVSEKLGCSNLLFMIALPDRFPDHEATAAALLLDFESDTARSLAPLCEQLD